MIFNIGIKIISYYRGNPFNLDTNTRYKQSHVKNRYRIAWCIDLVLQLSRLQARLAYCCIYIPSFRYGLPSFSLTKNEVDYIQKPAVEQFLRVMGYEKGFPRNMTFAHQDFGGLNLPHLYSEMSATKVEALVSHMRAESALGKALMININMIQLISGSFLPILEHNCNLNYLDDNWIMHLRTFIFEINAKITIENIWRPKLQRENDICLMDMFRTKTNLTKRQLTLVNYWRIYYQVIRLSDICEPGDENKIQLTFTNECHDRESKMQQSCLHWPYQQKPGKKGFQLWISCLKQCFEYNKSNRKINWKLGKWLPNQFSDNKWKYYFNPNQQQIYYTTDNGYQCHQAITSRSHTSTFNSNDIIHTTNESSESIIPAQSVPGLTISSCIHSSVTSMHVQQEVPMETIPLNWKDYILNLPAWQRQFLKHTEILDKDIAYASLSTSTTINIINDGGTMITNQDTFGSVISNGEEVIYTSKGKCYNNHYYMSSYRSESQAILAGLLSLDHLRKFLSINATNSQEIKIYCDNKKLIRNLKQYIRYNMTVNDHNKPDYDIIIEIVSIIKRLRQFYNSISFHYIKSKKENEDIINLSILHETQMHRLSHQLAQQAKSLRDIKYIPMPHNLVNFTINDHHVNANMCKVIKKCYHSIKARSFLQEKYEWDDSTIDNIWWNTHAKSLRKLHLHNRIRIQKYIHNHCSTNHRDHVYYDYKLETCNTCHASDETEDHILQCQTNQRRKLRKAWCKAVLGHDKKRIPLDIRTAMSLGLQSWLEKSTESLDETLITFSKSIQQAFHDQTQIGWDHFARGRLSLTWGTIINDHFNKQQFDAEAWGTKLIDINFEHLLIFWEDRCKNEHGTTVEDQEYKTKKKLLHEILYMQQTSYPRHDNDAKIIHHDFEELRKLNSKQLQDWMVGAKIIYKICKKNIKNIPSFFLDTERCQEIEVDPG